jgi:hypothetical protein
MAEAEITPIDKKAKAKSRRPKEIKTQPRMKNVADAQLNIIGFCACGRPDGTFKMDKKYCSRYCYIFMTRPAEGFKKKTMYEAWRGSGKYSYNPPYPKIMIACAWCNEDVKITRSDENKHFCGNHCMRQAHRSAIHTSARVGSKKIGDRVRILRILREFSNEPLTAKQVSAYWNEWYGNTSCSPHKSANLMKMLMAKNLVAKIQIGTNVATYKSLKNKESLKSLFGEEEIISSRPNR